MKNVKQALFTTAAITIGAIALSGCATKDFVREQVAAVDAKNQQTQSQVDQQQQHLAQLDKGTQDALDRATAAGKLAEGKFL